MVEEREIQVENHIYRVILSDNRRTLLDAQAAGRVFVGVLRDGREWDLSPARYLVETPEAADDRYLERVVRREKGLPWIIAETRRLQIREFVMEDLTQVLQESEDTPADKVFYTQDLLQAYIRNQYGFYEYGLWALVRKEDGVLVGKAGVTGCRSLGRLPEEIGDGNFEEETEEIRSGDFEEESEKVGDGSSGKPTEEAAAGDVWNLPWRPDDDAHGEPSETGFQMELGYHVFRPYRRQGYGEEACRGVLEYIRQEYGCPVYAVVHGQNRESVRLLKKLGFERNV